jgi:hypothetical protein
MTTTVLSASASARPRAAVRAVGDGKWRAAVLASSLCIAIAWTLGQGNDVHWDAVNYHLYLGFSAVNDRSAQDFFAAGPPSYLNPYAYVPLYLMSAAGWSAVATASALAAWHSLALWLTYEIARVAAPADAPSEARAIAVGAALLALSNPVVLQTLGATMADMSTAVLVLAGWAAIAHALRRGGNAWVALGGIACGIAAALKLSNAIFALAALPALAFVPGGVGQRLRALIVFGVACAGGFACAGLGWSVALWREFGNPFFPFFNQYFASPAFTAEPLRYERFIPNTAAAFIGRPLAMLSSLGSVHTEPRAPDLRYVILFALFVGAAIAVLRRPRTALAALVPEDADRRVVAGLASGFLAAWCLWLSMSGNSRYFVPMACVAAVLIACGFARLHARWPRATKATVLVIVTAQAVQLAVATDLDREGGPWQGPWLAVDVPERLRDQPYLYLSTGFLSGSALLPYVHHASGMINVAGFNVIGPGQPGWERAGPLIERNADRLRLLLPLPAGVTSRATLPAPPEQLRVYVRRLGLRVDAEDCEFIGIRANLRGERRGASAGDLRKSFIACRLVLAPEERAAYEALVRPVDAAFDRVEDACPTLFHPRRQPTQEYRYLARTYHMGSEAQLFIDDGRVKYFFPLRGGDPIDIGSVDAWRQGPQPIDCAVRTQPAFIRQ